MILVGELSLWVALLMAAWSTVASYAGGALHREEFVSSGARGTYAAAGFALLASAGLCSALLTSDFSLRFVASYTTSNLPSVYKLTAFWGGPEGSLLLWALLLSACSAIAVFTNRRANRALMPWTAGTLSAVLLGLLFTIVVASNPYERLATVPQEGRGLLPDLQNVAMALHPPLVCLGYVATTVPFAFVVGALVTKRFDPEWVRVVRTWSLMSWAFLTAGILLGMWWAYSSLGWGGVWAWDPMQTLALLPWLANTAFLHAVMVQEKRGMLRGWSVVLVVATFFLAIVGASVGRGGSLPTLHGLARGGIGYWFGALPLLALATTAWLVFTRRSELRSSARFESSLSREGALASGTMVLGALALVLLLGTFFPMVSARMAGTRPARAGYFDTIAIPAGLLLLALMGGGPLLAWRRAVREAAGRLLWRPALAGLAIGILAVLFGGRDLAAIACFMLAGFAAGAILQEFAHGIRARRRIDHESHARAAIGLLAHGRRRYGGYVVHLGFIVLCAGLAGSAFTQQHDVTLGAAQAFSARDPWGHDWTFMSLGVSNDEQLNRIVRFVALTPSRDGRTMPFIRSEARLAVDALGDAKYEPSTVPGILHTWREDVYVVFTGVSPDGRARGSISFNPLVTWTWFAGALMLLGGLIALWPEREGEPGEAGYRVGIP